MGLPAESLIVALDVDAHKALSVARSLVGCISCLKVGMTLYYSEGPAIVSNLRDMGFDVFLDLKLYDIPHQVEGAARELSRLGVSMLTVHASGGLEMMRAAMRGAHEGSGLCGVKTPDVLAVSVLTSSDESTLRETGIERGTADQVELLIDLSRRAGVHGVVCSPLEATRARDVLGPEALVVTPGIRPAGACTDDQLRVATPRYALEAGASHIVVGRPITAAKDPARAVERVLMEG